MANRKKASSKQAREFIHSLRGKYKTALGGKPFAEWMAEMKREERELEERKFQRHMAFGKK